MRDWSEVKGMKTTIFIAGMLLFDGASLYSRTHPTCSKDGLPMHRMTQADVDAIVHRAQGSIVWIPNNPPGMWGWFTGGGDWACPQGHMLSK